MESLPRDLIFHLLSFLDVRDYLALNATCRALRVDLSTYLRICAGLPLSDVAHLLGTYLRRQILRRLADIRSAHRALETYRRLGYVRASFLFTHGDDRIGVFVDVRGVVTVWTIARSCFPERADPPLTAVIYRIAVVGRTYFGADAIVLPTGMQVRLIPPDARGRDPGETTGPALPLSLQGRLPRHSVTVPSHDAMN